LRGQARTGKGAFQSKVKRFLKIIRGNLWECKDTIKRLLPKMATADKVHGVLSRTPEFIAFVFLTE
jgi:hypothetical protein